MKKGTNLRNSYQTDGAGGSSAALVITAINTAGTPTHRDDAAPPVRLHQRSENRTPRDTMVDPQIFAFINVIRQHLGKKVGQPRIRALPLFSTHSTEELGHILHRLSDSSTANLATDRVMPKIRNRSIPAATPACRND